MNKMVSLCDTHWGNYHKFVKFVNMARVQRVKCNFRAFRSTINHSEVLETHQGAISTLSYSQVP
jgi:hypothetical protein